MKKQILAIPVLIVLFISSLSACTSAVLTEIPTVLPTLNPTDSATATPTLIPTPTSVPTPSRPSIPASVLPPVIAPISVENASKLTRLASLGEGDLVSMQLSPDEKWLVFNTTNGVLVLDSTTLKKVGFLSTEMKSYEISYLEGVANLTARDCYQGYIWSIPDGKVVRHVKFLQQDPKNFYLPYCRSFPDPNWEKVFVLSSNNQKTGLYSLEDGTAVYTLDYEPQQAVISPDRQLVVLFASDKLLFLQYSDGRVLKEIEEPGVKLLFFSPDGETLAAVEENQTKFWNVDDFQLIDTVNGTGVGYILFDYPEYSPDGSVLVFRKGDNYKLLRASDRLYINTVTGYGFKYTSDNRGFIVDSGFGQITEYLFNEDRSQITLNYSTSGMGLGNNYHYHSTDPGVFSSDNSKLLFAKTSGSLTDDYGDYLDEILIFDLLSGGKTHIDIVELLGWILVDAVWLPALNTYGVLLIDQPLLEFDVINLETKTLSKLIGADKRNFTAAINFSPRSDLLVFAQGNQLISWDIVNNSYWQLPLEQNELPSTFLRPNISFSADGKEILFSDLANVTHVYNSDDYLPAGLRDGSSRDYRDASASSPDGKYSAVINFQGNTSSVVVSDTRSGKEIINYGGWNTGFAFSFDSKMIALSLSTTYGNKVSIYELSTGKELFTTGDHFCEGDWAPKVVFSPDGKYFAILPQVGYPQIWGIP